MDARPGIWFLVMANGLISEAARFAASNAAMDAQRLKQLQTQRYMEGLQRNLLETRANKGGGFLRNFINYLIKSGGRGTRLGLNPATLGVLAGLYPSKAGAFEADMPSTGFGPIEGINPYDTGAFPDFEVQPQLPQVIPTGVSTGNPPGQFDPDPNRIAANDFVDFAPPPPKVTTTPIQDDFGSSWPPPVRGMDFEDIKAKAPVVKADPFAFEDKKANPRFTPRATPPPKVPRWGGRSGGPKRPSSRRGPATTRRGPH